jgi:ankyrin repeat protein
MQNKLSVYSLDSTYKTPLMWGCIRGHSEIVELLITRGVNQYLKDMNHKDALDYAVKYNHTKCVKVLLLNCNNSKDKYKLN